MLKQLFRISGFKISVFIAIVTLAFAFLQEVEHTEINFLQYVENKVLDNMFIIRGRQKVSDKVAILAIDEKSVDALGHWPWPRSIWARILDKLSAAGVKIIAFDVVFPLPDNNNTVQILSKIDGKIGELTLTPPAIKKNKFLLKTSLEYLEKQNKSLSEQIKKSKYAGKLKLDYDLAPAMKQVSAAFSDLDKFERNLQSFREFLDEELKFANQDEAFAAAIKRAGQRGTHIVLGYYFYATPDEVENLDKDLLAENAKLIAPSAISIFRAGAEADYNLLITPFGIRSNIPILSHSTPHYGYFNQLPDRDGIFRRTPMFMHSLSDSQFYPSLSLKTLSLYLGQPISLEIGTPNLKEEQTEQVRITIGDKRIPVDDSGRFVINYAGEKLTFNHYSVLDILSGQITAETLKDSIILVGATTIGIYDVRHTPMDEMYPGVEIHANIIENILHDNYLLRPNYIKGLELLFIIMIGVVLGLLLSHLKLQYGFVITIILSVAYFVMAYVVFFKNGFWLKSVLPGIEMYAILLVVGLYRYMTEEREKGKIRTAFQTYMSPAVVEQVLKDPEKLKLGGERKDISVLFSDIRGFTTLSETLSPVELVHFLNEYFTPMTDLIFEHRGTLDKYMGDAIMAFWGAPLDDSEHAKNCCNAALAMIKKLNELRKDWEKRNLPMIDIGIGINSGSMSVGNMGSSIRMDYTVMGDNVNLGSRLEGLNKPYNTNIIISQYTRELLDGSFETRILDKVQVKGKTEPVLIYELLGKKGETPENVLRAAAMFEQGFGEYQRQRFDDALQAFRTALEMNPSDGPSKIYLERVNILRAEPPGANWDGVWIMKTK